MVAGDIQGFRILGGPEAHESPQNVLEFELGLNGGRLDKRHSFLRPTHRSRVDVVECSVDSQREKEIVRRAESVEARSQLGQVRAIVESDRSVGRKICDRRERNQNVVLYFSHTAVRADLKEVSVCHDHFTVQALKGA